jgi:hypothetical protein
MKKLLIVVAGVVGAAIIATVALQEGPAPGGWAPHPEGERAAPTSTPSPWELAVAESTGMSVEEINKRRWERYGLPPLGEEAEAQRRETLEQRIKALEERVAKLELALRQQESTLSNAVRKYQDTRGEADYTDYWTKTELQRLQRQIQSLQQGQ